MTCHAIMHDGALVGFVCDRSKRSRPRPCACGRTGSLLCDGRVPGTRGRTRRCDAPICHTCATVIGEDLHHCRACAEGARARLAVTRSTIPGALVAYTDGSGTIATRPCGAGVVVYDEGEAILEASVHLGLGTNNVAELGAVRVALWMCGTAELRRRPLVVRSDSLYTIDSLLSPYDTDPRAPNGPLINVIRARLHERRGVTFEHVKGHQGEPGNERADVLAGLARLRVPRQRELVR